MSLRGIECAFNVIAHINEYLLGICKGILLMLKLSHMIKESFARTQ
jgi:hypothetical protein